MKRLLRISAIGLGALVVLAILGVVGLNFYLSSSSARTLVGTELGKALGTEVKVTELNAGWGGTSVTVEIPAQSDKPNAPPSKAPLLTGTVSVDASPLGLATGGSPKAVTVENARLTLRLDEHNDPIDKFPEPQGKGGGAVPAVKLRNATVHIVQAGKPDFEVSGVDADLTPEATKLTLGGRFDDKYWGKWAATGGFDTGTGSGSVTLATAAPIPVTPERLNALPFVPKNAWEQITMNGTSTVSVTVGCGADKKWYWHVDCEPHATTFTVREAGLALADGSCKIVVDGEKVTVLDGVAKTADGTVTASAVLDFAPSPSKLDFHVTADGLDVTKLPKKWGFPVQFHKGKVKGGADITLLVKGEDVQYQGGGKGVISGAEGLGIRGEIDLALKGDGRKLSFDVSQPGAARTPARPAVGPAVALLAALLQPPAAGKPPGEPTTVTANLKLKDVDIAELLSQLQVKVPIKLGGKASLNVSAVIPVADANSLKAYKVKGTLSSPELIVEDLHLLKASANVDFDKGVLTLTSLSGELPPDEPGRPNGSFKGTANFGVDPRTDLTADLVLTDLPTGQLAKAYPATKGLASGAVSGSATFRAPGDDLGNVAKYTANGSLTAPVLVVAGRRIDKLVVNLALKDGVARVTNTEATVEGLPVAGAAALTLSGKFPFEANVRVTPTDPVNVRKLAPEAGLPMDVVGKVDTAATAAGTISPLTYQASGTANVSGLTVGSAQIDKLAFGWRVTEKAVVVSDLKSEVYGGTIAGSATVPIVPTEAGAFDVGFDHVDSAAVTKAVPSLPVKLAGKVSGALKGTLPAVKPGEARQVAGGVDLAAPELRLNGLRVTKMTADVKYRPGFIDYKVAGKAASGTIESEGQYPLSTPKPAGEQIPAAGGPPAPGPAAANPAPQADKPAGFLRVRNVQIAQLIEQLTGQETPARGVLNVNINYTLDPATNAPTGGGRVQVDGLGWGRSGNASLATDVKITGDYVEVPDLSGRFADGQVRGRARYYLKNPRRSFYSLTLDGVDLEAVLAPFGYELAGTNGARFSLTSRGNIGRELTGSGTVSFQRAKLSGFDLASLQVPFSWSYDTTNGSGRAALRDFGGQVAGGRLTGQVEAAFGSTVTVDGKVRFVDLSFRSLLGGFGASSGLGSGRMNGSVTFTGQNVRSANDVGALVVAQIGAGPVLDTPIFGPVAQFLVPSGGSRGLVQFDGGELRGRLSNGQFRVERLALSGRTLQMFVNGTVGLNGRLDLELVAMTNRLGIDPRTLQAIGIRIPTVGPVPVGLILEITAFLSNQTVRLHVGGTTKNPSVQVNVAALLSEQAIRYFLAPYLPFTPSGVPPQ